MMRARTAPIAFAISVPAVISLWAGSTTQAQAQPPDTPPAGECIVVKLTAREALSQSSMVFEGRVVQVEDPQAPGLTRVATFDVDKVWKGAVTERQVIYRAGWIDASVFNVGDRLVVFARPLREEERVHVGLQRSGPPVFGDLSFNCAAGLLDDADSVLSRMRFWKPR